MPERTCDSSLPALSNSAPARLPSSKKRPLDLDASSTLPPFASTADPHTAKRLKASPDSPGDASASRSASEPVDPSGARADSAQVSSTASSDTLAASATTVSSQDSTAPTAAQEQAMQVDALPAQDVEKDETSALDGLSAEQRRVVKGKGRAYEDSKAETFSAADGEGQSELERLRKELAFKDSLLASHLSLLSTLHGAIACNVCLETLDKPYSLGCGHVFCRKCLLNWFFRSDPDAEPSPAPSASGSGSGSDSEAGSIHSSSTRSSYIGGHIQGREFRRTDLEPGSSRRVFAQGARNLFGLLEEAAAGRAPRGRGELGGGAGTGGAQRSMLEFFDPAATSSGGAGAEDDVGNFSPIEEDEMEGVRAEKPPSPGAMRRARLARFGEPAAAPAATKDEAKIVEMDEDEATNSTRTSKHFPSASAAPPTTTESVPLVDGGPSAIIPSPPRAHSPDAALPAAAPPPPPPPARSPSPTPPPALPTGAHRLKNLVCPQCRTACSATPPFRVFALEEVVSALRGARVNEEGVLGGREASPKKGGRGKGEEGGEDASWGGLWKKEGGERKRDKRRRLAQVVRDTEDGIVRCGECNWEVVESSGACQGCGRTWDLSSAASSSESDYPGAGPNHLRIPLPFHRGFGGRQHEDVQFSGSSSESEEGSGSDDDDNALRRRRGRNRPPPGEEEYESDGGFIVASADEAGEGASGSGSGSEGSAASTSPAPTSRRRRRERDESDRRRRRRGNARLAQSQSGSASQDDDDEDADSEAADDAAMLRELDRRRRRHPRSASSNSGSGSASGSGSDELNSSDADAAMVEAAEKRQRRKTRHSGEVIDLESDTSESGSGSGGGSASDSESEDDDVHRQPGRSSKYFGASTSTSTSAFASSRPVRRDAGSSSSSSHPSSSAAADDDDAVAANPPKNDKKSNNKKAAKRASTPSSSSSASASDAPGTVTLSSDEDEDDAPVARGKGNVKKKRVISVGSDEE